MLHTDVLAPDETAPAGTLGMLTPEYASPEQVRGEPITPASDIYSLAVVLYELLTAKRPHRLEKLTPQALERAICEEDVERPSLAVPKALGRRLQGDLDNIVLRALQKDPKRRYASADHFAEDIRRHLSHQPVKARPDTIRYRTLKFARRHRGALTASGLVAASLIAGIFMSVREANLARANLLEARRLANSFVFDIHDAVRDLPGSTRARQLIVSTGLRFLDGMAKNSSHDWELQSELATAYQRIGDVQGNVLGANLGNTKAALESYKKALMLLDSLGVHDPENRQYQVNRLIVQQRIGALYIYTQDTRQALVSFREAERFGEELLYRNPDDEQIATELARIYLAAGNALRITAAFSAAIDEDTRASTLLMRFAASHPNDPALRETLASAHSAVGMDQTRLGFLKEALDRYRTALALLEKLVQEDPGRASYQRVMLSTYSHLGDALGNPKWRNMGDPAGAVEAYQKMLRVARNLYESDPANQQAVSDYAIAMTRVAATLPPQKSHERLGLLRESLRLLQQILQVNSQNVMNRWDMGHGYMLLGDALLEVHDTPGAIRAYQETVSMDEALLAAGVTAPLPDLVTVHEKLGLEAARKGDRDSALLHARRALEVTDPAGTVAKGHSELRFLAPRGSGAMGLVYALLARMEGAHPAQQQDDRKEALMWLQKSLAAWRDLESDTGFLAPAKRRDGPRRGSARRIGTKMTTRKYAITSEQKRLVRDSMPSIEELAGPIGKLFFGRLFELDPSVRGMFHQDIAVQGQKIMAMLRSVVKHLDDFEDIQPALGAMGQRHLGYGVRAEHYQLVETAFLWALGAALDTEFCPSLKIAWRAVLQSVSIAMQEGASRL